MKKVISLFLAVFLGFSCFSVFADSASSENMEKALLTVKGKLDNIPVELSEFTVNTYQNNGNLTYSFMWQDKEGRAHIETASDSKGRISRYYFYDSALKNEKKLTQLTKSDILEFAESFLKRTVPEAFSDESDILVFDESSWNVSNMNYRLLFKRKKNGIDVKDNQAEIRIAVFDDVAYVRSMDVYMNYDAEFEEPETVAEDIEEKYKEAFPIELIYKDEYSFYLKNSEDENKPVLIYRYKDNKAGFVLAENGETAEEDLSESMDGSGSGGSVYMNSAVAEDSASKREMLTEQERTELEKIEGLISKEEAQKILKALPYTDFNSNLKLKNYDITENDGEYILSVMYENENGDRYISASLNGKSGELLSFYNRTYSETYKAKKLSDSQKSSADKKMQEFLKAAAGEKLSAFEEISEDINEKTVRKNFNRMVNGIRYINDSISISFDGENGLITNYRIDFDESKEFSDAKSAISAAEASAAILKAAPLKKIYMHTGGIYKVCFTVSAYNTEIDAFTGEKYEAQKDSEGIEYKYSDISGHWAEEKINKLAEIQIGFEGEKFSPEESITQYDLLRLFAAGIYYRSYLDFNEEDLYQNLMYDDIISEAEKNPDATVTREDAFVYMIRMEGLEKVAKLSGIFKVSYADEHLLSKEKIGYPAILTGMGIISGSGGKLRPNENITRAEAMVMLYNYMVK